MGASRFHLLSRGACAIELAWRGALSGSARRRTMLNWMRGLGGALLGLSALAAAGDVAAGQPTFGEGAPFGDYQGPSYPEGIVVDGNEIFVSGPANFDQTGAAVHIYHRVTGDHRGVIPIQE